MNRTIEQSSGHGATDYRIILERPDGGISIVVPVRAKRPDETEEQYFAIIAEKAIAGLPSGTVSRGRVRIGELPKDRTNRDNWRWTNGKVDDRVS